MIPRGDPHQRTQSSARFVMPEQSFQNPNPPAQTQNQMLNQPFMQDLIGQSQLLSGMAPGIFNIGEHVIKDQINNMNAGSWIAMFRSYFNVSNSYVIQKLKLLSCPLLHKSWQRISDGNDGKYSPPRVDINAPDLYIPTMSFITYILIISYLLGASNQFSPERMASVASSALFMIIFQVLGLKLAFYLLLPANAIAPAVLDLFCYLGYIFVGTNFVLFIGYILGSLFFYGALFYCGLMMAVFIMRTMTNVFLPPHTHNDENIPVSKRKHFLLIFGLFQLPAMFWLART